MNELTMTVCSMLRLENGRVLLAEMLLTRAFFFVRSSWGKGGQELSGCGGDVGFVDVGVDVRGGVVVGVTHEVLLCGGIDPGAAQKQEIGVA